MRAEPGPPGKTGCTEPPCPALERGGLPAMRIVSEPWGRGKGFPGARGRVAGGAWRRLVGGGEQGVSGTFFDDIPQRSSPITT